MQPTPILKMLEAAVAHHSVGRLTDAVIIYRQVLDREPNNPDALNLMGVALSQCGQGKLGAQLIRNAIALRPTSPAFHGNLGNSLYEQGEYEPAIRACREAIRLQPNYTDAMNNLGNSLKAVGQVDLALDVYREALRLDPNMASAHRNLGVALLLKGQYPEGWAEFEWRWKLPEFAPVVYRGREPIWDKTDPRRKTLMIHAEQGFGDVIQFIRYVPVLQKLGAKVIYLSPDPLIRLLNCLPDLVVVGLRDKMPPFDAWYPVMSLPHGLGHRAPAIPDVVPLAAGAELIDAWGKKLGPRDGRLRVGLAWAGSTAHKLDKIRSLHLSQLAPLAAVENVVYYSLQKGPPATQAATPPAGMTLIDLSADLHDFADTAAAMSHLDLVIAVDTAPLHLAGTMGRAAWALLPTNVDWRWLQKREDSPWYPSIRLFRQRTAGDWSEVIERVAATLQNHVHKP